MVRLTGMMPSAANPPSSAIVLAIDWYDPLAHVSATSAAMAPDFVPNGRRVAMRCGWGEGGGGEEGGGSTPTRLQAKQEYELVIKNKINHKKHWGG
jgi:hypothetical protein